MLQSNKNALSAAVAGALGLAGLLAATTAAAIPAGNYIIAIQTTPVGTNSSGTFFKAGRDGAWNSTFSFGLAQPGPTSQGMTDNGATSSGNGSGIAGDGYAGKLRITVGGNGNFTVGSLNVDTIFNTAGGDFAQHLSAGANTAAMTGTINNTTGAMTFRPTGRRGSINAPVMIDKPWLVDDCAGSGQPPNGNTTWQQFTTGVATNPLNLTGINGSAVTAATGGDINLDGTNDYQAILVSGGSIGFDWGDFYCANYFETWKVYLLTATTARDDTATVADGGTPVIDVLNNDIGPGLTITAVTQGTLGTVADNNTNITYTSTGGTGPDSFTYTVQGSDGISSTATVNVTILPAGTPLAQDDSANTDQGQSVSIGVTANDTDDGSIDVTTVVPTTPTANGGTVVDNNDGTVTYTPASGFVGVDTFTYTVDDNVGTTSGVTTVTVTVASAAQSSAGTYAPGTLAAGIGSTSGIISAGDLSVADDDASLSCIGGCFDFTITGAANPTSVVLPALSEAVQADSVYRKLIGGAWQNFDTSTGDMIASTDLAAGGGCPAPADGSWVVWSGATAEAANAGHVCLRLTIADNGANDADSTAGTIADPGGLATLAAGSAPTGPSSLQDSFDTGGGCTLSTRPLGIGAGSDWLLVGAALAGLGLFRRRVF